MKKIFLTTIITLLVLGSIQAQTIKFRVLETTDIHTHIMDYDYYRDKESIAYGLVRTATLIKEHSVDRGNMLLVDNGDLIQGNPMADYYAKAKGDFKTHPTHKVMNYLQYDVGNLGNHEFNYGLDYLHKTLKGASFPYINANVFTRDGTKNIYDPYVIIDKNAKDDTGKLHKLKIGVLGFVPPQIMVWDKMNLTGKVSVKDMVDMAEKFVPEMKAKGADIIVLVPHSGLFYKGWNGEQAVLKDREPLLEDATYYLTLIDDVDVITYGHSHTLFPSDKYLEVPGVDVQKGTINGVAAVQANFWGSHIGLVDLNLELQAGKWTVTDSQSSTPSIYKQEGKDRVALVGVDEKALELVKEDHEDTLSYMKRKIGVSKISMDSYFAQIADSASAQVVNNAQIWYAENAVQGTEYDGIPILSAVAPFKTGYGGSDNYIEVKKGRLKYANVADLYLYPNTVSILKLTGEGIRNWLERSAAAFNQIDPQGGKQELINNKQPSYNFDIIDGVEYSIDVTQAAKYDAEGMLINEQANRIKNLRFKGKAIDEKAEFLLVINNYRAGGGGNFPGATDDNLIISAPDENRAAITNYIFTKKRINPKPDQNWSILNNLGKAQAVFKTALIAKDIASKPERVVFLQEVDDGYGEFLLK